MADGRTACVAVGFFDGVHLGHQAILRGATAALTFRNHPLTVIAPARAPRLIMSPEDRVSAIRACGVGSVTLLDFTPELANLSPAEFLTLLSTRLGGRAFSVRCGENWRFGRGGAGDAAFLRQAGIAVEVVPYAVYRDERVSSSRIRRSLARGEIEDANAMLGRRFAVRGTVSSGKGLGRRLGCPTVNLALPASLQAVSLPHGVYAVEMAGCRGVANYGLAPTLGADAWRTPVLEVHLLETPADLSGLSPVVTFWRFIRPERRFGSLEALKRQIAADCEAAGEKTKGNGRNAL